MSKLDCILNKNQIEPVKEAMRDIADLVLSAKQNTNREIKVTADEIFKEFKKYEVDVDLKSIAYLYRDVFASHIDNNSSNFQTEEELSKYENAVSSLSDNVKKALINGGFYKTNRNGDKVLDWYKIMNPISLLNSKNNSGNEVDISQQKKAVYDKIKEFVTGEVNNDDSITDKQSTINERVSEIQDQLKNEWAQIISNAISKKAIGLNKANEKPKTSSQSSAINRLGKMVALGLTESDNEYNEAMRKVLGISPKSQSVLSELDELGRISFELINSEYGDNNELGVELERQANILISRARHYESNVLYKLATVFRSLVDLGNLSILNNPANRGENWLSSKKELAMMQKVYGMTPKEIKELGSQIKKDISRRGGADFGGVTNQFFGDRQTQDIIREAISKYIKDPFNKRAFNRMFNFIFGTTALNGNDSATKAQLTWIKFISGLEDILLSKDPSMTKKEVRDKLNEQLFGKKWEEYKSKAREFMNHIDPEGKHLTINEQTVTRFAADIAKAELIGAREIDLDLSEVDSAYRAAYTSAGRGIGHVPNNITSRYLQNLKREQAEKINKLLKHKEYSKAGVEMIIDAVVSRGIFRMIGGGMNWGILKLQTGGLGIIGGAYGYKVDAKSFKNKKTLSELTPKEIQDTIETTQKVNDRLARGTFGAVSNTALMLVVLGALKYGMGDDDEEKKKWKAMSKYLNEHRFVNRYLNKFLPLYIATYFNHKLQQAQPKGYAQMPNSYAYNPALSQYKQLFFYNDETNIDKIVSTTINAAFKEPIKKDVTLYGEAKAKEIQNKNNFGKLSESISNLLNIDPLPYRAVSDMVDIYRTVVNKEGFDYTKAYDKNESYFDAIVDGMLSVNNDLIKKPIGEKDELNPLSNIRGLGEITEQRLVEKGIDMDKLKKMTVPQMTNITYKDESGEVKKVLDTRQAYSIKNTIDGKTEGEHKVDDMPLSDKGKKLLKDLGYEGIDENNRSTAFRQIGIIQFKSDDRASKIEYQKVKMEIMKPQYK